MGNTRYKFWGWGKIGEGIAQPDRETLESQIRSRLGAGDGARVPPPRVEEIALAPSRLAIPRSLAHALTADPEERLIHSYGKSYPDSVRAFDREFRRPPDLVAFPQTEAEVVAVLDHADAVNAAVIPFGGGSSVVGGVECVVPDRYAGVVSLDLKGLGRVLEVDTTSRAARIQAGILGPALEAGLKPHGLTLRHFPQSFEYSTLGGWIATRSGGHFATLFTHIDDLVESTRVVTPRGISESRRLPGSGAGPSPDRLFLGSEGILGVITEAWMRLQATPTFRAGTAVRFTEWDAAVNAVRTIAQAGLYPANCRLVDGAELRMLGAGDGSHHALMLAFENADHPVTEPMRRVLEIVAGFGGQWDGPAAVTDGHRDGDAGAWRSAFIRAPFLREEFTALGVMYDTFETAITWDRFPAFHSTVMEATRRAIREVTGGDGIVTCRFTHLYPDGPAPYYSFVCRARRGAELDQWRQIKQAASEALLAAGGTITHHHAVGRDHRPWYDRQRPEPFAIALRAAKTALDPKGLLNPGVLLDPLVNGVQQTNV
jgi:alkyldihydroxyacetonephosphate synthase